MRLIRDGTSRGSDPESDVSDGADGGLYLRRASAALNALNAKWFSSETGLWADLWWNSACMVSTISSFGLIEKSAEDDVKVQLRCVFKKAPGRGESCGVGFLNEYYDDEGWWALGWIEAFDLTQDVRYLAAAEAIFRDMTLGLTTPCGGIWWNKSHTYIASIANELFLSVAAHLANRAQGSEGRAAYRNRALKHWHWFLKIGVINSHGTINDGITTKTCSNNGGTVFSYNQGVILGALVELSVSAEDSSLLEKAHSIALAAITALSRDGGILTEPFSENPDNDSSQFKGVFVRNLAKLHRARPDARFSRFLRANADSVWGSARQRSSCLIGHKWQGPYRHATAPTQDSGIECLLAAAAVLEVDRQNDVRLDD